MSLICGLVHSGLQAGFEATAIRQGCVGFRLGTGAAAEKVLADFYCSHTSGFAAISLSKSIKIHQIAKLILISKNCPPLRKSEIEYYAML
jgi:hypothetical protein